VLYALHKTFIKFFERSRPRFVGEFIFISPARPVQRLPFFFFFFFLFISVQRRYYTFVFNGRTQTPLLFNSQIRCYLYWRSRYKMSPSASAATLFWPASLTTSAITRYYLYNQPFLLLLLRCSRFLLLRCYRYNSEVRSLYVERYFMSHKKHLNFDCL
jgi:hypothetical protein